VCRTAASGVSRLESRRRKTSKTVADTQDQDRFDAKHNHGTQTNSFESLGLAAVLFLALRLLVLADARVPNWPEWRLDTISDVIGRLEPFVVLTFGSQDLKISSSSPDIGCSLAFINCLFLVIQGAKHAIILSGVECEYPKVAPVAKHRQ
jgi:hypothetical protein